MYILYQKYCDQSSDDLFSLIINELKWMILRDMKYVDYAEREDFKQSLYMKIHKVLLKAPIQATNDFKFEWFEHEEEMFKQNKYLAKLIHEYGMTFKNIINITDNIQKNEFESLYKTFVGDVKLYQYFSKVIKTFRINYIKAYEKDPMYHAFRLNRENEHHQEYINTIQDDSNQHHVVLDLLTLNDDEMIFIKKYENSANQTDLSKDLGISQQAVSKKYKKIIRKLKASI